MEVEISGKTLLSGILIDIGQDLIVLFNNKKFYYLPLIHMHCIKGKLQPEVTDKPPNEMPIQQTSESNLSYRKTLTNAKGQFVELFVTGNRPIHGYITSVMNDYIVFYSPVYKTMFISMSHLKWLIPYNNDLTPYTLTNESLPVVPSSIPILRSLEDQLHKYVGKLIVFDMGENPDKIGLVQSISNNIVHLITAGGEPVFWKITHLKTVHMP